MLGIHIWFVDVSWNMLKLDWNLELLPWLPDKMDALSFATFTCLLASIPIKYPGKSLGSLVGQVLHSDQWGDM